MRTVVIGHSRSRQAALRGNKAINPPPRPLMPAEVEGGQLGEELQLAVRQVVMDPPGECAPIRTVAVAVGEPWHDDSANIGNALAGREIARHLRELGANTRGPAPLTKQDRSRFLGALDTALQAALREAR